MDAGARCSRIDPRRRRWHSRRSHRAGTLAIVIVERSMNDDFLSNTYVVADEPGGHAVLIDAGGPVEPLLKFLDRGQLTLTHVLLTHRHHDHVSEVEEVLARHPGTPVLIHEIERGDVPAATGTMAPGETIESGTLTIEPI